MPKTKQQKHDLVTKISEKLSKSKTIVFADYQGLTMSQLSEIRSNLADAGAEFSITKNNLLKIALKENGFQLPDEKVFSGPVATLFSYEDEVNGIKILTKALKDNQVGQIKGGLFNGEVIDASKVNQLASLPSKDQLRAQVVSTLGFPLYGIVGVLQANLRNLVYVLSSIKEKQVSKGGEKLKISD